MNSDDDFVRRDDVVWEERSQCCAAPQEDEYCGELDSTFISCLPEPDNVAGERQQNMTFGDLDDDCSFVGNSFFGALRRRARANTTAFGDDLMVSHNE